MIAGSIGLLSLMGLLVLLGVEAHLAIGLVGIGSIAGSLILNEVRLHRRMRQPREQVIRTRVADLEEGIVSSEKKILDKIEAVDREIQPKLKKRAMLNQELDQIQQKKGYRG